MPKNLPKLNQRDSTERSPTSRRKPLLQSKASSSAIAWNVGIHGELDDPNRQHLQRQMARPYASDSEKVIPDSEEDSAPAVTGLDSESVVPGSEEDMRMSSDKNSGMVDYTWLLYLSHLRLNGFTSAQIRNRTLRVVQLLLRTATGAIPSMKYSRGHSASHRSEKGRRKSSGPSWKTMI